MSALDAGRKGRGLWLALALAAAVLPLTCSATTNLFVNTGIANSPQIDATAALNSGTINYSDPFGTAFFQMINTHHFTNLNSGTLNLDPGLRFELVTNNVRSRSDDFINDGTFNVSSFLSSSSGLIITTNGFLSSASGGVLTANATNLVNTGTVNVGTGGLIHFEGNNVNLSRGLLSVGRAGASVDGAAGVSNYVNAADVKDVWWAVGTNQVLRGTPQPLDLPTLALFMSSSTPFTPVHDVVSAALFGTNSVSLPFLSFGSGAQTHVRTVVQSSTNVTVSIVVVLTNAFDTNVNVGVRFQGRSPVVEFSYPEVDILSGLTVTNYCAFFDGSPSLTNLALAVNLTDIGFRPNAYDVSRAGFSQLFGSPSNNTLLNTKLTIGGNPLTIPNIIYSGTFSNSVVTNTYLAYAAEIGNVVNGVLSFFGSTTSTIDPTNLPGRIELLTDNLDLTLTRMRTDNTLIIQTTNLISAAGSVLDARTILYNVSSPNASVVLTNFLPTTVKRYNGDLFAYTALWTNTLPPTGVGGFTNAAVFSYNLLFIDGSQLGSLINVDLPSFSVKGTNVVLENRLNASQSFVVDAPSVTFNASNQLFLSFNTANVPDLTATNLPSTAWFTNFGFMSIPNQANFGSDRSGPWSNMVNRGIITDTATSIKSLEFDNSGSISANGGPINIQVQNARLEAVTNVGFMFAQGAINFSNSTLKVRNHQLSTAASLNFNVTNLLSDSGPGSSNVFSVGLGFNLLIKPATADLIGTTLASFPPAYRLVPHVWAADDRGPRRGGFSNNAAVGHLVLNPSTNSLISFRATAPTGVTNAMYVDFLELQGNALTNLANYLTINSNFYLYFASANVPVTNIDGLFGGHLRWVRDFAGPTSGIDVVLPNGQTFRVNQSLIRSTTIDTDNDGIPNAFDLSPFDGVTVKNITTITNVGGNLTAFISWDAVAQTDYIVEFATQLAPPDWSRLVFYTNNLPTNATVTVQDTIPPGGGQRFYRVNYQP